MITPSFGLTATERVLPKLALDFTTAALDARVTFARAANTATRVNSIGLIETVLADTPRFDFDPVSLVCKGLLIEESRSNVIPYSQDAAFWTTPAGTLTANDVNSPLGVLTGNKFTESVGTGFQRINFQTYTQTATTYTTTTLVKNNGSEYIAISPVNSSGSGNNILYFFDFTGATPSYAGIATYGASIVGTYVNSSVKNFGDGWWLLSVTYTTFSSGTASPNVGAFSSFTPNGTTISQPTGDGVSGFWVAYIQSEAGAFPTSYTPTEASAVTRNADVATMTGTNFSDWFNATEGTFQMLFTGSPRTTASGNADMFLRTGDIQIVRGASSLAYGALVGSGTFQSSGVTTANLSCRVGLAYKATENAFVLNNGTFKTDAGSSYGTLTSLSLGSNSGSNGWINSHIQKLNYWPQRLIDNEIKTISK